MTTNRDRENFRGTSSLARALELLMLFRSGKEYGLTEIAELVNQNKATVYRILNTFVAFRILAKDDQSKKYRLSVTAFELGQRAAEQIDLRVEARPYLEKLVKITKETVHLSIFDNNDVICIDKVDSPQPIRLNSRIAMRTGSGHSSGSGKVLLAYAKEDAIDNYISTQGLEAKTAKTITDPHLLKNKLAEIRQQGFAFDDCENQNGVRCVGVPVRNHMEVIAAISVAGPRSRLTNEKVTQVIKQTIEVGKELSVAMGWTPS